MRPPKLLSAPALLLALTLLAACSGGGAVSAGDGAGDAAGDPPAGVTAEPSAVPTASPASEGVVSTRVAVYVMDRGDGPPELCLGAVAESWPPQCGGPQLVGWDWAGLDGAERQGPVRWGTYLVTGTWDGTALTVTDALPGMQVTTPPLPDPLADVPPLATPPSEAELARIAEEVSGLGGAQGAYPVEGRVLVDVTFDDGSLQAWADEQYGAGVVVVVSALAPVDA
ncbi:hypothetical protein [Nocardioides perillae]|uniref:Uncharacterized protein n=1 Tax=Nocardioides perillae TaxID=1119534 RepID=A0A7Y9RY49_9ACTN|nr:hypothetical protein [Nocardioides perillae]NYG56883.1 hypothetical protein [Nocardioides perillae]